MRFWRFTLVLALLLIGFLSGGVTVNLLVGHQIDVLSLTNQQLQAELRQTREELEEVQANLAARREQVVTGVKAYVTIAAGASSIYEEGSWRLDLAQEVEKILAPLKGQKVAELDYGLIPRLCEGRLVEVQGEIFALKVNLLVVRQNVTVYVTATPRDPQS